MFSFITKNWRGKPLTSYQVVVELVAATTTETGLRILAEWDQGYYPTGTDVTTTRSPPCLSPPTTGTPNGTTTSTHLNAPPANARRPNNHLAALSRDCRAATPRTRAGHASVRSWPGVSLSSWDRGVERGGHTRRGGRILEAR